MFIDHWLIGMIKISIPFILHDKCTNYTFSNCTENDNYNCNEWGQFYENRNYVFHKMLFKLK